MTLIAVVAGLLIGASLGALGGGGSILTVPALVYLLGQSPHRATAAVVGALAGGSLAGRASPQRLSAAFTVLVILVAGYTLARSLPGLV